MPAAFQMFEREPRRRGPGHAFALILALTLMTALTVAPAVASKVGLATVTLTKVAVDGSKITIAGRVRLPTSTAKERRRAKVSLTLTGANGPAERFTAKLAAKDRFTATHTTTLSGALRLAISVEIAGRIVGRKITTTVHVAAPAKSGTGTTTPATTTPATTTPGSPTPTALDGTFDLTPGTDVAGAIKGSWFEMLDADEAKREPLQNGNSPLENKDYTPLSPGANAGVVTSTYQPAPSPAFSEKQGSKEVGNALADEIMEPQSFFGFNFSVVTEKSDPQTGEADPLPYVVDDNGQLSGQITAWAVGWNGEWFNQGSPKPNGTLPSGTTALSGSYSAATGQYDLEWRSLIVGGPFNGFLGSWHLEGTFVPAS
ncbi:MAG: hypothetical protein ABSG95_14200 [Solirubrobacteraceae bacterium]